MIKRGGKCEVYQYLCFCDNNSIKDHRFSQVKIKRAMWEIYWIILWLFTQTQCFSTTVVKEGEDAIIECGLQTKVEEGYLKWEAVTNDNTVILAYDLRDGFFNCDDRIINCTIHANGSIQLESVSKEDGARYYRCLRGDEDGYNYYSDHRLSVLSKEETYSPPSIETPQGESVSAYDMDKKGVLHGYNAPVCEDDVDGNLPVDCYPPPGIIVDREYETIQCNCTDSDGLMDSVTFPVTSVTHLVDLVWRTFFISLLVITILLTILVLIWICLKSCKNLKKTNTNREHAVFKRLTQREVQVMPVKQPQEMLETEMKNELEENTMKIAKKMAATGLKNRDLNKLLQEKQDQPQIILESSLLGASV